MIIGPTLPISQAIHEEKYRDKGESFDGMAVRISRKLADNDNHYRNILEILRNQRFLPAGRVQAAIGSPKIVTAFNCFTSSVIEDNSESIFEVVQEAWETMRKGGGIGFCFSRLRPRGDVIESLSSRASGPVSFMEIFDAVCRCVQSAGHRRGAMMGVLRIDHPDIMEFVRAKQTLGRLTAFNVSVAVTDEFMEAVKNGTTYWTTFNGKKYTQLDARNVWDIIMDSTWDWAEPGILFIDRINQYNNMWYAETIVTTNPCFTGDTKVWTAEGHIAFKDLVGKDVEVLTQTDEGKLVYRKMTNIRVTQRNADLVEVTLNCGSKIRCTPQHKFYLRDGSSVEAKDLTYGMSIQSVYRYNANQRGYKRLTNRLHTPLEHHVPFGDVPRHLHVHHINGVRDDNRPSNLEVVDGSLHNSEHMLGDLNPMRRFPEKNHFLTADFSGENNGRYRSDIRTEDLIAAREVGLSYAAIGKQFGCSKKMVMDRVKAVNHKVDYVISLPGTEDVYCGSVEETGKFFLALGKDDGVLVSNCGEQPLPPTGACLLGSFNLVKYVVPVTSMLVKGDGNPVLIFDMPKFEQDIRVVVRAMDNIIDNTIYPLRVQEEEAKAKRRMGLGITGVANALEVLGYAYGSPEYIKFQSSILETLRDIAYDESVEIARIKGTFPLYDSKWLESGYAKTLPDKLRKKIKKYGLRNSHLLSIAPCGTISLCADNVSSGIEPVFSHSYTRTVQTFDGPVTHEVTDYAFREFGIKGRTADEISPEEHVAVLCAAQKYVDSAVSKTCNIGDDVSFEQFKNVYMMAYEGGAKGCTTFRAAGKRMGVLNKKEVSEEAQSEGGACFIDPDTGKKTCDE